MKNNDRAAVFVLLGQSNAVGHGIPMEDKDKIHNPLKNVFGLNRATNQSFENKDLNWSGYTSFGMNLAESQDDTYSVANCLAKLWQDEIDSGNKNNLGDLYIVHIAIGAQGVTDGYMWNPGYERKLIPGELGMVDISLYPFTNHILSLVKKSFDDMGKTADIKIHWRGGENDTTADNSVLESTLKDTYHTLFDGFYNALGEQVSTVFHKIVCHERCMDLDPSGASLVRMNYIDQVFEELSKESDNITIFDVCDYPHYIPDIRGNGLFINDVVHFTPEVNRWVAEQILKSYI